MAAPEIRREIEISAGQTTQAQFKTLQGKILVESIALIVVEIQVLF